jgi:histidine phosphotransfer protein HptB
MTETLDISVLAELREAVGDDPEFVDQMVDTFLADAPGYMAAIEAAVRAGSAEQLLVPAHTLKGNGATIGATRLAEIARGLEEQARSGDIANAGPDAEAAAAELQRVVAALEAARIGRWVA